MQNIVNHIQAIKDYCNKHKQNGCEKCFLKIYRDKYHAACFCQNFDGKNIVYGLLPHEWETPNI